MNPFRIKIIAKGVDSNLFKLDDKSKPYAFVGSNNFKIFNIKKIMRIDKAIGMVGTGIFLLLTLQGVSFIVSKILEEVLLFTGLQPLLMYGLIEYASLFVVLLVFIYALTKIKHLGYEKTEAIKRLFLVSIAAYIITQVAGFALPLISKIYETSAYFNLKEAYYHELKGQTLMRSLLIEIPTRILQYVFIAIFIWREFKLFETKIN